LSSTERVRITPQARQNVQPVGASVPQFRQCIVFLIKSVIDRETPIMNRSPLTGLIFQTASQTFSVFRKATPSFVISMFCSTK
jgi:hypothetical protein